MAENDLEQWLQSARNAGLTTEQITQQLKASGWTDEHIDQIFGTPNQPATTQSPLVPSMPGTKKFMARHLGLVIGIGIGVLLLGGTAFAALRGYIPVPFLQPNGETVLAKTLQALQTVKSGEFGLHFSVSAKERDGQQEDTGTIQNKKIDIDSASNASQLRTALALYYDQHTAFPRTLNDLVSPVKYISLLPKQPDGYPITYTVSTDQQDFTLTYPCASTKDKQGKIQYANLVMETCTDASLSGSSSSFFSDLGVGEFISSDTQLAGSLVSFISTDTTDLSKLQGSVKLQGSYTNGGTSYQADIEARIVARKVFLIANTLPAFPLVDTGAYTKKWFMLDEDATKPFFDELAKRKDSYQQDLLTANTEISALLKLGVQHKALLVGRATREDLDGSSATKVPVQFDFSKTSELRQAYMDDAASRNANDNTVNMIKDILEDDPITQNAKNVPGLTLTIWVNPKDSMLRKAEFVSTIEEDPNDSDGSNAQITFAITLAHVNEQPSIVEPTGATPLLEALEGIFASPRAKARNAQRKSDLGQLRTALALYYDNENMYPEKLQSVVEGRYISQMPAPPREDEEYSYSQLDKGRDYKLCGTLEEETDQDPKSTYCFNADGIPSELPLESGINP